MKGKDEGERASRTPGPLWASAPRESDLSYTVVNRRHIHG